MSAEPHDLEAVLRERFGLEGFRPWQREAIDALLHGAGRVLVVAPTGGGKSLTYQLPAVLLEGTAVVVSPLVALMEDQVRGLVGRGVRATYIASTLDLAERRTREAALLRGEYELVYIAPERLASDAFVTALGRTRISLVAIDEAHCIAQWGHDFRPDYLRIGTLLERLRPERVLACTATATSEVRREIRAHLGFEDPPCHEVLRGFARPNLHLAATSVDGPKQARAELFRALESALGGAKSPDGAAIVYAATRKTSEQTAATLRERGWNASFYHAGMSGEARSRIAGAFAKRKIDVVVATNAFGMGIDRSDIRVVVHVQPPASIEAYYQEVGRAGRDGKEASGLLLCSGADIALRRRLVQLGSDGEAAAPALAARAWSLFRELLRYVDARTCRHDFVLRYFGDEHEVLGGCGHCDVCLSIDEDVTADDAAETTLLVRKALSGVARAQRRGGLVAIAEMLHGDSSAKTTRFGFTELSTFGLLKDRSHDFVMALLRALLAAGWIDLTTADHPVPYLTVAGALVMKGEAPARVVLPTEKQARGRGAGREGAERAPRTKKGRREVALPALDDASRTLFEKLREHRASVAKDLGVPAYVVAFDRTLVEIASHRPRTKDALREIHGMGPARIDQYGDGFLEVIAVN